MEIIKEPLIKNIPNRPFAYEFVENDYILIHSHSLMLLFDMNGNLITQFNNHSNGFKGLVKKVTDEYFTFGNEVFDNKWNKTKKKFKASKKSVEKYGFTFGPKYFEEKDIIIAGFQRGIISFYDKTLKVLNHIELSRDEHLIKLLIESKTAFTYSEKRGLIIKYSFPDFTVKNEYRIGKQNRETIITDNFIFNYGYTSTNFLINLETDKTEKIQFHQTRKSGYKEQYSGTHNFGTSWLGMNQENHNEILVCTDKSKSLIYNLSTSEMIELKAYEKLGFDRFKENHKDKHMHRGFFKGQYVHTNFGSKFILWDRSGNDIMIKEKLDDINIDSKGQTYSLTDENLYKTFLKE